jgi:UDP-N-acetyl-2-amino-2-deoxyglucuronate dehydrogenase
LGLVGCGAIAQWHLRAIARGVTRTDVTAVVDVDSGRADALAAASGAVAYTDLMAALDADVFDAALVMVPHHLHEAVATTLLGAGCHLLLEKPMAPTVDACDRILATADKAGTIFMVAENAQYWPEVLTARGLLQDGSIGEVVTARSWHCAPPLDEFYGGSEPWRFSATSAGGGVAVDTGSHWLRPLRMWLGELQETIAVTARPMTSMEGESLCRALCRFESGVVASFDVILTPGIAAPLPLFQLTGTAGEIVVDYGRVTLYNHDHPGGNEVGRGNYFGSYAAQIADFERVVLDGNPPAATARYAVGELRGALAMYRSAESGRWEPVW